SVPERGEKLGQPLVDQAKFALDTANELAKHSDQAVQEMQKDGLADAKKNQNEVAQFFSKVWEEAKKQLEKIAEEIKAKVKEAVDRLLKKLEQEVLDAA